MVNRSKRKMLTASSAAIAAGAAPAIARAQAKEVKIGLIVPLTGPWARSGDLMRKGAEMAIEDINAAGGIKSMGGARMRLVVIDAGENVEKAKNAAQRMLSQEPDLTGATGAWVAPEARHWGLLVGAGICLGAAHQLLTLSMRAGDMSVIGLFRYSGLLFALMLGYAIWGDWPNAMAWAGIALIVAAGVMMLRRERARARAALDAAME